MCLNWMLSISCCIISVCHECSALECNIVQWLRLDFCIFEFRTVRWFSLVLKNFFFRLILKEKKNQFFAIVYRTLCRTLSFPFSFSRFIFAFLFFLFFENSTFRMKHHRVSSMIMDLDNWNSNRKMPWYKNKLCVNHSKWVVNLPIKQKEKNRTVWLAHLHGKQF